MSLDQLFWTATLSQQQKGYALVEEHYHCLLCSHKTEVGIIIKQGEEYLDAKKAMERHISFEHVSVFDHLLSLNKKDTGLSDHQSAILQLFYQGHSDYEVQKKLNIGSISTVRNHRYALREKEKQARIFITAMTLLDAHQKNETLLKPHKTAKMVDERYDVAESKVDEIIAKYFPDGTEGPLKTFSMQEKKKIVLREIIKRFVKGKEYTEKSVDQILKEVYPSDHALIRRYLIQYGFMDRTRDGSVYWVKEAGVEFQIMKKKINKNELSGGKLMKEDRKKVLKHQYKDEVASKDIESGVFVVKNNANGKVYVGTARNINQLKGISFQLNTGSFINKTLQEDWNHYGEEQFSIEVVEQFIEEENFTLVSRKLKELERAWIKKLNAYGDLGYHKKLND